MMLLTSFWQNPAVVGIIIALPATALGYLGYRRSLGLDRVAEQAGMATTNAASIGQVVDGLNKVIVAVQSDNSDLRKEVLALRATVDEIRARLDAVETGNIDLRAKNQELERENGALHAENEALRVEVDALRARIDELERNNGPLHESA